MGGMDGLDLLEDIKRLSPEANVVIMTSHGTLDIAIAALKAGAYDFLTKPFENLELVVNVAKRAMQNFELIRERKSLIEHLTKSNRALKDLTRRLRELAIRAGLTGLYNHSYLIDALAGEVARATRYERTLSVIFFDVDFFKKYNDQHGHQHGDTVLRKVSQILKDNLRKTDVAARYGGEEFVIILPEASKENAHVAAEKIRKAVEDSVLHIGKGQAPTRITTSAGVATFMEDGRTASELIAKADEAVYQAKSHGRNAVRLAS